MNGVDTSTPAVALKLVPEFFDHAGLGIVRSLGRMGVRAIGFHDDLSAPAAASRYDRAPEVWAQGGADAETALPFLRDLGRRLGQRAVLIPTDDVSCVLVAESGDELREWFVFPRQEAGLSSTLYSKQELYLLCKRTGVPTPVTLVPESLAEAEELARELDYPVVLKAIDSWLLQQRTGARMAIVQNRDELRAAFARLDTPGEPNLMLQEYIPGGPESVWMFNGYFDERSECLVSFTGRKLRQFPPYTGLTSLGVCVWNDRVAELTTSFMKSIGYRGILDIGWRYDERDDQYKLLDVNPRVGATFRLFVGRNGLDVVRALYLDLIGQPVPASEARDGRKWVVENLDLVSSRRYALDGALGFRQWARSFRGVEECAWFAADDPKPFALMCARFGARKARGLTSRHR